MTISPASFTQSPAQKTDASGLQDSPFLDYDYSFDAADSSFDLNDFSFDGGAKMIVALPGDNTESVQPGSASPESETNEVADKRSHPDDDEDEENGAKRRESSEKVPKKPGRKPLTSEPSSVSGDGRTSP